jgi:hypothetical protein
MEAGGLTGRARSDQVTLLLPRRELGAHRTLCCAFRGGVVFLAPLHILIRPTRADKLASLNATPSGPCGSPTLVAVPAARCRAMCRTEPKLQMAPRQMRRVCDLSRYVRRPLRPALTSPANQRTAPTTSCSSKVRLPWRYIYTHIAEQPFGRMRSPMVAKVLFAADPPQNRREKDRRLLAESSRSTPRERRNECQRGGHARQSWRDSPSKKSVRLNCKTESDNASHRGGRGHVPASPG